MIKDIPTKQLAEALESTSGFASNVKSGLKRIPPQKCLRVSQRFGIPLHELRPDIYPAPAKVVDSVTP